MKRVSASIDSPKMVSAAADVFSRRALLQAGAAAGLGSLAAALPAALPGELTAAEPAAGQADLKAGAIDAHVHVWTPNVKAYPLAEGFAVADMKPPSFTPEELLALARPCGVSRIVLIQMSFYGFDNRYMLETIERFPGVFSGVAVIDETDKPAKTMRLLLEQGVRGFRIRPGKQSPQTWLDSPGMATMWKTGAETGQAMCHLINPDSLPAVDKMCQKFPRTPVVIDHFARIGVSGAVDEAELKLLCDLARHKQVKVKTSAFYALGKKQQPYTDLLPMIGRLLDAYGPERLMWATDCPYQVQDEHTYTASIELVRDHLKASESDRDWLLRKTAEATFFA